VGLLAFLQRIFGGKAASAERRDKPRVNAREGTRVLIVDDSPTIVALLRKLLQQNGYVTIEAGDAEEGIRMAQAEAPDLIFLDIVLPGMNGFAALRQLRRDPRTKDIPIIMISGNEQATEQFYAHRTPVERREDAVPRLGRRAKGRLKDRNQGLADRNRRSPAAISPQERKGGPYGPPFRFCLTAFLYFLLFVTSP
jgi:CheY-like chemotaxis protein